MTSYTVTATATNNTFTGGILKVWALTNAALAGTPATGSSPPQTAAFNCSVTTTQTGSFVFGVAQNDSASTAFTASAGTTITDQGSDNGGGSQGAVFHTTSATGTPGATAVGSSTAFPGSYGCCALEVLASGGTLTIDNSVAAQISTTATSFNVAVSSSGGLLVVAFAACGNGSAAVPVASVSSAPSLGSFTEQVHANSTVGGFNAYIGVWTAIVPPSPSPPSWAQRVAVVPFSADVIM